MNFLSYFNSNVIEDKRHDLCEESLQEKLIDPWTFTDTITVYNWEDHPDWDKYPLNLESGVFWGDQLKEQYAKDKNAAYMIQLKYILCNYKCIGWDNLMLRNTFIKSEEWENNKFYPVVVSNNVKNLYCIEKGLPIITHTVDVPNNKPYTELYGQFKIYYRGNSDTGSTCIDTVDVFNKRMKTIIKGFENKGFLKNI